MKKLLFEKAFEKAKKASGKTSKNGISDYLSYKITEDFNFRITQKTFVRYYEKYIERNGDEGNDPRTDLLDALAEYLAYENFESFVSQNFGLDNEIGHNEITNSKGIDVLSDDIKMRNDFRGFFKKKKITIGSIIIALLISYLGYDLTKKECMIWVTNHYEKIKCDGKVEVKYNEAIFNNLKQIDPDCSYLFFKPNGSENLWYGKSSKGELEFFTYHGLHPTTGQTLDPITQYMIDKYICEE